jgi:hypothetical protein
MAWTSASGIGRGDGVDSGRLADNPFQTAKGKQVAETDCVVAAAQGSDRASACPGILRSGPHRDPEAEERQKDHGAGRFLVVYGL